MLTIGVDLAAEAQRTAAAGIEWTDGSARLTSLAVGIDDVQIVALAQGADVVAIDCAFGWPAEFVAFVSAHERGEMSPRSLSGRDWRRRLAYRHTDRAVREVTGRWPLSVSTDRLGMTALHCAELLAAFEAAGERIDRSGAGRLVEVYPAAALRLWGVQTAGYKTQPDARMRAAESLLGLAPWLDVDDGQRDLLGRSDDALDALAASLNARAHALGHTLPVPDELRTVAQTEGWIALPTAPLDSLTSRSNSSASISATHSS
ncbi:DUF429 domain-containing protein [Microbacterium barkeri]|uniref:DUF429 domain-containing protein n=1 Tax=Microbacterium barkeri TaxID=33917 RepID=UPI0024AE9399|nr:DUF429 domain-containing protein [Microbacterium barkeri]MDI6943374.1 DUF429 domain-containing protein [Microbacterium barkeri]